MNFKLLFLCCILLLLTTTVCAAENSTDQIIKKEANNDVKATTANSISVEKAYGETYYGSRITYTTQAEDDTSEVDEGKVELYVNNTHISTQNAESSGSFDWIYGMQNNQILDNYPAGNYPIKLVYKNNKQALESSTTTLTIEKGQTLIDVGEISVEDGKIIVPTSVLTYTNEELVTHGTITARNDNTEIAGINCNSNSLLEIPGNYQQKTITLQYTDNKNMLQDSTREVFLDVIVEGTKNTPTSITIANTEIINTTHTDSGETIIDGLALRVTVDVTANNSRVTGGGLKAYHKGKQVATSNNATSIILPVEYNQEEITLEYTGINDYDDSTHVFTVLADKITTRTYISRVTAAKNSIVNIYPSITSNNPFLYGKVNIYLDDNLVKTITTNDEQLYISLNSTRTTLGSTLNLEGYSEGTYTLKAEVEENNVFTESEYTSTLTINKINTYIYANNRNIYVEDTVNLYAYAYANNRQTLNTGQMSFTIDDELIGTEHVKNNTASIEYPVPSRLGLGEHTLKIVYEGDDTYNTSTKNVTLTLTKTSTTTVLRTWTVKDEKIVLNTLVRAWNKTINTGTIEANIDGETVARADVKDGTANITLPGTITTEKRYKLILTYTGSDTLNRSTYEQESFIFNKKNTTTRVYPYLRSNGTVTLTGYVYTENYARVDTGQIIFTINNKEAARANVANNKANTTYDMTDYDPGKYTIKATYTGSLAFKTSTNSSSVTKNEYHHKTHMNIANRTITIKRGKSTPLSATLTSYTRNITEDIQGTLTLNATGGNIVYTQDITFHNGQLNTQIRLPSDFKAATLNGVEITKYTLTITTRKSKNFEETSQTGIAYLGERTRLYQKTLWAYKEGNITFNTTLQDTNGKTLQANTTAHITIYTTKGQAIKSFDAKIVNGKLEYVYKLPGTLTNNTYTVNITAHSNNDYSGSYRTVNMTLNNRRTYISAKNTRGYIGNTVILGGTIMDSMTRSKANTDVEVEIHIDNSKIATVKASNGIFKHTITNNLQEGIHKVTYNYKGDTLYTNCTRTLNLTSNKNKIRIKLPTITAKIGDSINIKAEITDNNGKPVKDTLKANIQLNGKTIASNKEINNGILSYNYNIPQGTKSYSKITITIEENNKYKTRNATGILKISKEYQFINIPETLITTSKGSKISITGNITDKNKNLLTGTKINIKIAGKDTANITSTNGRFNYEYTVTQSKGTYDVLVTALEANNYLYNAKHMSLKVNS